MHYRALCREHQHKRATGFFDPHRSYLLADRMTRFEGMLGDMLVAAQHGSLAKVDQQIMQRMQLAKQQQAMHEQELQRNELHKLLQQAGSEAATDAAN